MGRINPKKMKVVELRAELESRDIEVGKGLKKADLVALLLSAIESETENPNEVSMFSDDGQENSELNTTNEDVKTPDEIAQPEQTNDPEPELTEPEPVETTDAAVDEVEPETAEAEQANNNQDEHQMEETAATDESPAVETMDVEQSNDDDVIETMQADVGMQEASDAQQETSELSSSDAQQETSEPISSDTQPGSSDVQQDTSEPSSSDAQQETSEPSSSDAQLASNDAVTTESGSVANQEEESAGKQGDVEDSVEVMNQDESDAKEVTNDVAGSVETNSTEQSENNESTQESGRDKDHQARKRKYEEERGRREEERKKREEERIRRNEERFVPPPEEPEEDFDDTRVVIDKYHCDLNVKIHKGRLSAIPLSLEGFAYLWAGVRATYGVKTGKVCYECKLMEEHSVRHVPGAVGHRHLVRLGWSAPSSPLNLGEAPLSYGYCGTGKAILNETSKDFGEAFKEGDVIGCYLEISEETIKISYTKNGVLVGEAFTEDKSRLGEQALYPHVASKNTTVEFNFGDKEEPFFPHPDDLQDFVFIAKVPLEDRCRGMSGPQRRKDCEVIMMCGLPGSGKTYYANQQLIDQPEKNFNILGTKSVLDRMKVTGVQQKVADEALMSHATNCLNRLFQMAARKNRNYILDQTNVFASAQRRKLRSFEGFHRRAVVIVPTNEEYKSRLDKRTKDEGKDIPDYAVFEMKANFTLPEEGEGSFDEVVYAELGKEEAEKVVEGYKEEARKKGPPPEKRFRGGFDGGRGGWGDPRGMMRAPFRGGRGVGGGFNRGYQRGNYNRNQGFNDRRNHGGSGWNNGGGNWSQRGRRDQGGNRGGYGGNRNQGFRNNNSGGNRGNNRGFQNRNSGFNNRNNQQQHRPQNQQRTQVPQQSHQQQQGQQQGQQHQQQGQQQGQALNYQQQQAYQQQTQQLQQQTNNNSQQQQQQNYQQSFSAQGQPDYSQQWAQYYQQQAAAQQQQQAAAQQYQNYYASYQQAYGGKQQ